MDENKKIIKPTEEFKLTRPYGTLKSDFDCLPIDIFEKYFKQPLINTITKQFKHRLLNHQYQERNNNNDKFGIMLEITQKRIFSHHDGTYNIVPDISMKYAHWDESNSNKQMSLLKNNMEFFRMINTQKSNITISCPKEYQTKNKQTVFIVKTSDETETNINCYFKSTIKQLLLNYDATWLIAGLSQQTDNICFFNINSSKFEKIFSLDGSITALCTAHKQQLFIVGSECGEIAFMTPDGIYKLEKTIDQPVMHVEFSPDDTRFLACGGNQLIFWQMHTDKWLWLPVSMKYTSYRSTDMIRKASFSSDGKRIIVAMEDGTFTLMDGLTSNIIEQSLIWRCSDTVGIDNQAPLTLWSTKNNLLLLLDPAQHTDSSIYTFMVRKSSNGRFLAMYNFFPNNPVAMGLTKDEETVVFIHKDNRVSCLHLYDNPYLQYIDFIENKANIYHLCELLQICKNIKVSQFYRATIDSNATQFINAICSCIRSYHNIEL